MSYELVGWNGEDFEDSLKGAKTISDTSKLVSGVEYFCKTAIIPNVGMFTYDATQSGVNNGDTIINGWVKHYIDEGAAISNNSNRITVIESAQSSGVIGFATKADMDADLAYGEGTVGKVMQDATPSKNGEYRKLGASGTGSWVVSSFDRITEVEENSNKSNRTGKNLILDSTFEKGRYATSGQKIGVNFYETLTDKSGIFDVSDFFMSKKSIGLAHLVDTRIYFITLPLFFNMKELGFTDGDYYQYGFYAKMSNNTVGSATSDLRTISVKIDGNIISTNDTISVDDGWKWFSIPPQLYFETGDKSIGSYIGFGSPERDQQVKFENTCLCLKKVASDGSTIFEYDNSDRDIVYDIESNKWNNGSNVFPSPDFSGANTLFVSSTNSSASVVPLNEKKFFQYGIEFPLENQIDKILFSHGTLSTERYDVRTWENGDTVLFGCWVKINKKVLFSNNLDIYTTWYIQKDGVSFPTSERIPLDIDSFGTWQWIEYETTITNISTDFSWGLQFIGMNNATAGTTITLTGCVTKRKDDHGYLTGYEKNSIFELEKSVGSIIDEKLLGIGTVDVTNYVSGAKIQNFLSKLNSNRRNDDIKICFVTDSIGQFSGDDYISQTMTWLNQEYGLNDSNYIRLTYGGYTMVEFSKLLESAVISENVDLFFMSEDTNQDFYEQIIRMVRKRTTADICIGTWSMRIEDLQEIQAGTMDLKTINNSMHDKRKYANMYNCEIVDFQGRMLIDVTENGVTPASYFQDEVIGQVHLSQFGKNRFFEEMKKIFKTTNWTLRSSIPNPLMGVEQVVDISSPLRFPHQENEIILSGSWSSTSYIDHYVVSSSTIGDFIEIPFVGVGIELYYHTGASSTHSMELSNDGGTTWNSPSSIKYMTLPLEYCTEIDEKATTTTSWIYNRFFKALVVNDVVLNDGEPSREYEITILSITSVAGTITASSYQLKDITNNIIIGTGDILADSLFTHANMGAGSILIPAEYAGSKNYMSTDDFTAGDTYRFHVKSNWADTVDTSASINTIGKASVIGLKNDNWILRVSKTDNNVSEFDAVKILAPIL